MHAAPGTSGGAIGGSMPGVLAAMVQAVHPFSLSV